MIDLPSLIAIAWAAFFLGMAYATRGHRASLREAVIAQAIVIDAKAYLVVSMHPTTPGSSVSISRTALAVANTEGDEA